MMGFLRRVKRIIKGFLGLCQKDGCNAIAEYEMVIKVEGHTQTRCICKKCAGKMLENAERIYN